MNFIDFILRIISSLVHIEPDDYEAAKVSLNAAYDKLGDRFKAILGHPLVIIVLPLLLIPISKWVSRKYAEWVGDADDDGDVDLLDLLEALKNKLTKDGKQAG